MAKEIVSFSFYGFLTFVWLTRVIITIVHPWNYDKIQVIQVVSFIVVFIILLIPFVWILFTARNHLIPTAGKPKN